MPCCAARGPFGNKIRLLALTVFDVILIMSGVVLCGRAVKRARTTGTLGEY